MGLRQYFSIIKYLLFFTNLFIIFEETHLTSINPDDKLTMIDIHISKYKLIQNIA